MSFSTKQDKPFEDREHYSFFLDARCSEIVCLARQHHLTPRLLELELRALDALVKHIDQNPDNPDPEFMALAYDEIQRRKNFEDTYNPVRIPPSSPEPVLPPVETTPYGRTIIGTHPSKEEEMARQVQVQIRKGRLQVLKHAAEE